MLLDQEVKKQEPKGKKIVLLLLILSIMLLIFAIVAMAALAGKQTKPLTLSVNGTAMSIEDNTLITDENGINYISINKISKVIGYDYYTGEYKQYNEDNTNTKGYLQNENQIIQFEADNKKIYKSGIESKLDYEEYELTNKILNSNGSLYVSLDDVNVALNIAYEYSQKDNKVILNSVENLTEGYKTSLPGQTNNEFTVISEEYSNEKAISYGMLVVSNENQRWGVIDSKNLSTVIIGDKYSTLEFVESAGVFIASDDGKYGIISKEPNVKPILDLNYEEVKVINNSPLCYEVKRGGKSAVINKDGKVIINDTFDSIGCDFESPTEESTLVIKGFGKEKLNLLVVCKQGKYGLVNLGNGETVISCSVDKIYSRNENNEKKYYVQVEEKEITLEQYIEKENTTTVSVGG